MLPKALKSCPKSNKSPNLVTLIVIEKYILKTRSHRAYYAVDLADCSLKIYFSVHKRSFYAA